MFVLEKRHVDETKLDSVRWLPILAALLIALAARSLFAEPLRPDFPTPATQSGRAEIEGILKRRVKVAFAKVPLGNVLDTLVRANGFSIGWDPAIEKDSIDFDAPITLSNRQVRLKTALRDILREIPRGDLYFGIRDGKIWITSWDAEPRMEWHTYYLADLSRADLTGSMLTRLLYSMYYTRLNRGDDEPTFEALSVGGRLHVRCTESQHSEIADLLSQLRTRIHRLPEADDAARLERILGAPLEVHGGAAPFQDFVAKLEQILGISIVIDKRALEDASIDLATEVSWSSANISANSLLYHVLDSLPQPLTAVTIDDELFITTMEKSKELMRPRVYDVRGLAQSRQFPLTQLPRLLGAFTGTRDDWSWDADEPRRLALLIGGFLVVRQTQGVHEEIADFLRQIRRAAANNSSSASLTARESREAQIAAALNQAVTIESPGVSLADLVADFAKRHSFPCQLDKRAMADAAIDVHAQFPVAIHHKPFWLTIEHSISGASIVVDHEMAVVMTTEKANEQYQTAVYPAWRMYRPSLSDRALEELAIGCLDPNITEFNSAPEIAVAYSGLLMVRVLKRTQRLLEWKLSDNDRPFPGNSILEIDADEDEQESRQIRRADYLNRHSRFWHSDDPAKRLRINP